MQSRQVFSKNKVIFWHRSKRNNWAFQVVLRTASHKVSSHQTIDLECFAENNNIPWNPPTIFHPDLIATVPQMSLPLFHALLSQQSHVFPICVVLTYNDSRIIPRKTFQIPRNCKCKILVSSSGPGTSLGSSGSPEKFLFCTGRIVTTELPSLVPQQRIDDYFVTHILHKELCDPLIFKSPKISAVGTIVPVRLLQGDLVILVLSRYRNFGCSGSDWRYYAYPIPLLLAALTVISWEELESSRCSGTLSPTRFSLNSSGQSGRTRNGWPRTSSL